MRRREEMNKATSKKGGARRRWLREVEAAGARLAAEQVSQGVLPPPVPYVACTGSPMPVS